MQDIYSQSGIRESVAEAVRVEMARKRMTQTKLSKITGLSQVYISRRMRGDVPFTVDDLVMIANTLGVTLSALLPVEQTAA